MRSILLTLNFVVALNDKRKKKLQKQWLKRGRSTSHDAKHGFRRGEDRASRLLDKKRVGYLLESGSKCAFVTRTVHTKMKV